MHTRALLLLLLTSPAHAGHALWADLYGGHLLEEEAGLSLAEDNLFTPDRSVSTGFDPAADAHYGLRLRWEHSDFPVGASFDLGYYDFQSPQADLTVVPVTVAATLAPRITLARSDRWGSLHPTASLGVIATSVDGRVNAGGINSEINDNTFTRPEARPGLQASLGLEWRVRPRFALFTEYRYQQMRFHLDHTNDALLATQYLQTTGRIETSAIVFGLSWRMAEIKETPTAP
ncbi:MAG: hypothetical protein K0S46_1852 [Moraxellaceae bacterium]|jgi:hypothetical protein|nr:hypothetical protein [Moraxellaceae bacterium]